VTRWGASQLQNAGKLTPSDGPVADLRLPDHLRYEPLVEATDRLPDPDGVIVGSHCAGKRVRLEVAVYSQHREPGIGQESGHRCPDRAKPGHHHVYVTFSHRGPAGYTRVRARKLARREQAVGPVRFAGVRGTSKIRPRIGIGAAAAILAVVTAASLSGCGEENPISTDAAQSGQGRLTPKDSLYVAEFEAFPNLSRAGRIRDWDERGRWVVARLKATAKRSQAEAIKLASDAGAVVRPQWISNVVILAGEDELGEQIGALPGVRRVWKEPFPDFDEIPLEPAGRPVKPPRAIDQVGAPAAWREGVNGRGVTIGIVDTGVYERHPALLTRYRGYRGAGRRLEHDGNWFAPIRRYEKAPVDNSGHGTHMAGSAVGGSGLPGGAPIGVAPGAKWIAGAGCTSSACPLTGVLPVLQFMLAPTDRFRRNPNPDLRPEIVANSWQRDARDVALERAIEALEAAGMLPVFAVGNAGPGCGTARTPGTDPDEVLSVGSVDADGEVSRTSGRGPAPGGLPDPDVVAPGQDVVSSTPKRSYASADGTSSAAAIAAGVAALALDSAPSLKGDPESLVAALRAGTKPIREEACGTTAGGRRNNDAGYGLLSATKVITEARREASR
jgi:subtilisin family serine protease